MPLPPPRLAPVTSATRSFKRGLVTAASGRKSLRFRTTSVAWVSVRECHPSLRGLRGLRGLNPNSTSRGETHRSEETSRLKPLHLRRARLRPCVAQDRRRASLTSLPQRRRVVQTSSSAMATATATRRSLPRSALRSARPRRRQNGVGRGRTNAALVCIAGRLSLASSGGCSGLCVLPTLRWASRGASVAPMSRLGPL
jgi:hypothetical protein